MPDEQDVQRFMQAVYDTREQTRGVAYVTEIMRQMGLEASSLPDLAHNPTTDDDRCYTHLAQYCEEKRGYIKSLDDRYLSVMITDDGIEYVESGSTRL